MDSEIIRTLRDGTKLILVNSNKRILYKHKIINEKGNTRNGYKNVIQVQKEIDPLLKVKKIFGCI